MTDERRPAAVVDRDNAVARLLAPGQLTMATIVSQIGVENPNLVYNSISRLRRAGLVVKVRVGGRTPVWALTEAGQAHVAALQVPQPA